MTELRGRTWMLALLTAGAIAGLATIAKAAVAASGGGGTGEKRTHEMKVVFDNGHGDQVEIDDLAELQVGESRSYPTESGKTVIVTRDEQGYELDLDGKTMRIGELDHPGAGERLRTKRIEIED